VIARQTKDAIGVSREPLSEPPPEISELLK
jgi:hypothetical protein